MHDSSHPKGTTTITMPRLKADIFAHVSRGRRIHRVARSFKADQAEIESIIVAGIRELLASAPLPQFRSDRIDGWGKRKPVASVVEMPARQGGVAA